MDLENTLESAPDLSCDSTDQLADEIAILSAHIQAATCRLLLLIAEMDRREGWADLGFVSCAHWLSYRTGDRLDTAREKVRVARKLVDCPLVLKAFSQARISYSKARAITRIVTPENEATLLEYALDGSASQLERIVKSYRRAAPAEKEQAQRQTDERYLSYHFDDDNMLVLNGRLPPEVGALLVKALQVASEEQCGDSDAEPDQRLCDALEQVAGAALDEGLAKRAGKARPKNYQVLVHVDERVLEDSKEEGRCEVQGGIGISPETAKRLCCDNPVLEMPVENSNGAVPRNRSSRRASAPLERAVKVRDEGVCQFPGCENRRFIHMHHVKHWAHGGPTDLDNLVLLCSTHHRAVHEGGFSLKKTEVGELSFRSPEGLQLEHLPPLVVLPPRPVEGLIQQNEELEISIHGETGQPTWDGMVPVDYDTAVEWLLEIDAT